MGGGGFLKSMVDSIRSNRDLVHKRESLKSAYGRSGAGNAKDYNVDDVKERVNLHLKNRGRYARNNRVVSRVVLIVVAIAACIIYVLSDVALDRIGHMKQALPEKEPVKDHFITYYQRINAKEQLRQDFFRSGPLAAETRYKNGYKHQNWESYYETGEQFRSASYFYDTLIVDLYFFKDGDTIKHMPAVLFDTIQHVDVMKNDSIHISFDMFEGKVLSGTYFERQK